MRILYVEDNPNDANLVDRYMQTTNHELVIVPTLDDARDMLQEPFDLVMLDVMFNGQRVGYDFARELRARRYAHPLVAVTALTTPQDIDVCYNAGFDYLLKKPFKITELAEIIDRFSASESHL